MIIAKKYRSNLVTKPRTHWSLKTRCGMFHVTLHMNKKLPPDHFFFLEVQTSVLLLKA